MCYATSNTSGIVVVSPTQTSQNIVLFFGLKPLQTDLVNIVWLFKPNLIYICHFDGS
jgi:hypothetical protein